MVKHSEVIHIQGKPLKTVISSIRNNSNKEIKGDKL